ncbi:MAG: hypothetical protein H6643_01800 [Caldilineaceae bacterium]|nr:hypothetical protein [Caldilineaceae bacterium]
MHEDDGAIRLADQQSDSEARQALSGYGIDLPSRHAAEQFVERYAEFNNR